VHTADMWRTKHDLNHQALQSVLAHRAPENPALLLLVSN
jgi:hypothetical protein